MLQILIAFFYSSLLCLLWGEAGIRLFRKAAHEELFITLHPCFTALSGMVFIGIILQVISLFTGLGGWVIQILMLSIPTGYFLLSKQRPQCIRLLTKSTRELHPTGWIFLIACSSYVLLIAAWEIIHPDSIAYHIPIMDWIRNYGVVPGLVNINERTGLQSNWFLLCSFFSFDFTGTKALTFINSTILLWLFYFLAGQISTSFRNRNITGILVTTILTLVCFGISTMFYLTAASVSPDFVVCIVLWAAFYLSYTAEKTDSPRIHYWLAILLLLYAPVIRLSALPAWIFLAYLLFEKAALRTTSGWLLVFAMGAAVLLPMGIRNLITTGYPLFPSTLLDVFDNDWKLPKAKMIFLDRYITEYARVGAYVDQPGYDAAEFSTLRSWVPVWWQSLGHAGKSLLAIAAASIVLIIIRLRCIVSQNQLMFWICITCIAGTGLWLWKAPAPRFMQAFLVPLPVIATWLIIPRAAARTMYFRASCTLFCLLLAAVSGYIVYRIKQYSDPAMIIEPKGVRKTEAIRQNCNGIIMYRSTDAYGCGNSFFPCVQKECDQFEKRGTRITDGFRPGN